MTECASDLARLTLERIEEDQIVLEVFYFDFITNYFLLPTSYILFSTISCYLLRLCVSFSFLSFSLSLDFVFNPRSY